jgi:16S rRNA (adenine1518-N6/adenine1519-N6)-dimethyltransferase
MTDRKIIEYMIRKARLRPDDIVLDIGAGKGALTLEINRQCDCIAVDIEKEHADFLASHSLKRTSILHENILTALPKLNFNKIIANIPYSISEPLFYALCKKEFDLAIMTIGERFFHVLSTDTKTGIILRSQNDVSYLRSIPKTAFSPPPRVRSCIIELRKKTRQDETDRLIRHLLFLDDKKIKNALDTLFEKQRSRREIASLSQQSPFLGKKLTALSNKETIQLVALLKELH